MTRLWHLLTLLPCFALAQPGHGAEPVEAPSSLLGPHSTLPQRRWQPDDAEAKSWQGPFAPALRTLLDAGLPDPQGLPYHRIRIVTGNPYSGYNLSTETEGWLLPEDSRPRFAIAWNGLVYPVEKDHGKADLSSTVKKITSTDRTKRAHVLDTDEATRVDPASLSLIHGLYLTRLGFPEAAAHLLQDRDDPLDPSLLTGALAEEWIWSHYERSVHAHMSGDPRMVLASLENLEQAARALEPFLKTEENTFDRVQNWKNDIVPLRRENERHLQRKQTGRFDEKAFLARRPATADLIDALDRIQLSQNGQPGDVPLWESPVVRALVDKGNEAVEPLLQCLEQDQRLTRSVHFWRDYHKSRTILGVREAALYALQDILGTSHFLLASTGDSLTARDPGYRQKLAAGIRASWEKYGRQSGPGRAYAILQDDDADPETWIEASGLLLHRPLRDEETGKILPPQGPMPGEVLRHRSDPSVSDLLAKRVTDLDRSPSENPEKILGNQMDLLLILLEWDPARGKKQIVAQKEAWIARDRWNRRNSEEIRLFRRELADRAPELLPLFEKPSGK